MPTNAELLETVRGAISAILTGGAIQEYEIAGKSIKKYSLKDLQEYERELMSRIAAESPRRTLVEFRR